MDGGGRAQFKWKVCSVGYCPGYCTDLQPHSRVLVSDTSILNYWEFTVCYGAEALCTRVNYPKPIHGLGWGGEGVMSF